MPSRLHGRDDRVTSSFRAAGSIGGVFLMPSRLHGRDDRVTAKARGLRQRELSSPWSKAATWLHLAGMPRNRLEAFSDGVLAIIITIMVLELKVPHGVDLVALRPLLPTLLSYVLSFVYVGIYWNNHHHLFHSVPAVSGGILWANLHL